MGRRLNKFNPELREKFAELNISAESFQAGTIYETRDLEVKMPGRAVIEDKPRLVVVLGSKKNIENPLEPLISVVPITKSYNAETLQDLPVSAGTGNLNYDSFLKAGMIQPMLKKDLTSQIGILDGETFMDLKAMIYMNLGLGDEDEQAQENRSIEDGGDGYAKD